MGFLTRLLAGLTAAAALGAGLTGTANAVDVTGATGNTKSVVKLTADGGNETSEDTADNPDDDSTDADSTTDAGAQSDAGQQAEIQSSTSQDKATAKSSLPDHIVNGSFDYPACPDGKNSCDVDPTTGWGGFYVDYGRKFMPIPDWNRSKFGWDSSQEGLRPDQQPNSHQKLQHCVQIGNKPNNNGQKMNRFAEIIAETPDEYIYQDIATTPGVMYRWSLKHASEDASHVDSMQVTIGSPGKETAQDATRTTSNGRGDRTGVTSKTIATKGGQAEWETYTGVYIATSTVTRFTFKSAQGRDSTRGNFIDDVMFTKAYKLTYDKNSADASGQVPSNQRGKENTTQPAESKATGNVKTVSDDAAGRTVLECRQSGEGATGPYADKFCWIDWSNLPLSRTGEPIPVRINVPGGHIDADATITHTDNAALTTKDFTGDKWSRLIPAYRLTGNTALAFHHIQGNSADPLASVMFSNITPVANQTATSVNVLKDFQLAFGDAETMSGYVVNDRKTYEQTDIESDKTLDKLGMIGDDNPNQSYSEANTGYGTTHVTLAGGPAGKHAPFTDDSNSKGAAVIGATQPTRFKVSFKQVNHPVNNAWSAIAIGVYMPYLTAYPLTYDKNSSDASGQVPSNQRGKENTVQPAKAKTTGTVKLAADGTASGLPVHDLKKGDIAPAQYGDFKFSTLGNLDANQITDVEGFTVKDNWFPIDNVENPNYVSYLPSRDGATLTLKHVGEWVDSSGVKQWINARLIVNNPDAGCLYYERQTRSVGMGIGKWHASASSRPYLDMSVEFLLDDGTTPQGLRGVTGFTDLDGGTSGYNEGVELVSGFDGAYVRSDAHLTRFGTNGWAGNTDENANASDSHGMKHYLGATFTGSSIRVRYSVTAGQLRGSLFQPVDSTIAFRLTYDKNAQDAAGQVPSDTTANTVKQAKAKTTGTVRAVADRTASGLTVHDLETDDVPGDYRQFVLNTTDTRLSQVEFEDGAWYKSTDSSSQGMWPLRIGASLTIPSVGEWTDPSGRTHQISMTMRLKDWNGGSVSELYRFDGHGNIVGDGRFWINTAYGSGYSSLPAKVEQAMGKVDTSKRVGCSWTVEFTYADTGEKVPDTFKGVTGFNDLDGWDAQSGLKFEGVQLLSGFNGAYKRSDAELGTYGTNGFAGIGHDAGDEAHLNAPQQSRHRLAATWTGSTFTFSYDLGNPAGRTDGSRMTFGAPVTRTAVLTYDKNAADASGQVPSNTTPDTTQTASSKSTGKVSDLVQRTTTHEDGSVTVKTIDTSTDVVSGCQVYYPAGQRITLATMAKDDDCWDSSMLSRPGHTQLGWNQDRNATQAQAQVTMVEGGMTVYAVWVGNPVLTYDTNKPATWNGQMPSTPASVSVAYNTAAADGSGWRAGDTTKIRGYRFLGWYTGPQDNAGLYDWTRPLTGSVTVYAHWQRLQANVVYNANGGTGSHPNTTGWQYSDVTIPGDTSKSFKRDKYVFKGWGTKPGKADVVYKDGSKVALQDKDITLYAQWQEVHENFVETGGIGLPIAIAGGVLLLMFGIGSTVMLTRRMNGHGMPDDE